MRKTSNAIVAERLTGEGSFLEYVRFLSAFPKAPAFGLDPGEFDLRYVYHFGGQGKAKRSNRRQLPLVRFVTNSLH